MYEIQIVAIAEIIAEMVAIRFIFSIPEPLFRSPHFLLIWKNCNASGTIRAPVNVSPMVNAQLEAGLVSVSEMNGMKGSHPSKTQLK